MKDEELLRTICEKCLEHSYKYPASAIIIDVKKSYGFGKVCGFVKIAFESNNDDVESFKESLIKSTQSVFGLPVSITVYYNERYFEKLEN